MIVNFVTHNDANFKRFIKTHPQKGLSIAFQVGNEYKERLKANFERTFTSRRGKTAKSIKIVNIGKGYYIRPGIGIKGSMNYLAGFEHGFKTEKRYPKHGQAMKIGNKFVKSVRSPSKKPFLAKTQKDFFGSSKYLDVAGKAYMYWAQKELKGT